LLNKPLLREINDKKRTSQYGGIGGNSLSKAGEMISAGERDALSEYHNE